MPIATSTVEKTKGQVGSEKQDKAVMGKEPEQQIEDEQWEFIRDEVEKMKEARESAQKEQQELKIEQERIREQKLSLRLKRNEGFKHSEKRHRTQYCKPKRDLMNYKIR